MKKPVLVWFRRDLRLEDNPAFAEAAGRGPVIPVFIWSPQEERESAPGAASRWWLHHSLASLDAALRERGLRLILRCGPAAETLAALAQETGAAAVAWARVWEPALQRQQEEVSRVLTTLGVEPLEHRANLLFEPTAIKTDEGRPYRVFTPFWNRCSKQPMVALPKTQAPSPTAPKAWPASMPLAQLGLLSAHPWHRKLQAHWKPGETAGRAETAGFMKEGLADYRRGRDFPALLGTSRLSARLHFGELSVKRLWSEALARGVGPSDKGGFLYELGWRDFGAHVLHHFPRTTSEPLDPRFRGFPWRQDEAGLTAWKRGRTGFPIVDAGMRELWETGWMHNRVRMIVASFLTKDLLADWREGAAWFWDTLVDADLAANTLGWQWTAGCGADAAPFFRIFNPSEQKRRWDEEGKYVDRWAPEAQLPILDHAEARARALDAFKGPRAESAA